MEKSEKSGKSDRLENIIGRLLTSHDEDEVKAIYGEWSDTYDEDLAQYGYIAPKTGATLFHEALQQTAADFQSPIFDAGCGTGLVGQALTQYGYNTIDGGDFSADMLTVARTTGRYRTLTEIDLQNPLTLPDSQYDGIISIGVYNDTMQAHFLTELLRIAKPNAILCISCRPHYFDPLHTQITQLAQTGRLTTLSITHQPYITGQNSQAAYILLQKQ